jgi:hypothetical protein
MKKLALAVATLATLAAVASAPAEAHGLRGHHHGLRIGLGAAAAVATVAAIAADAATPYDPYGYYYGPRPLYYGAPVYAPGFRYGY